MLIANIIASRAWLLVSFFINAVIITDEINNNMLILSINECDFHITGLCGNSLCNLPAATKLPTKVIVPIIIASTAVTLENTGYNESMPIPTKDKAPTNAEAKPPILLSSATNWGISIIFTLTDSMLPIIDPMII